MVWVATSGAVGAAVQRQGWSKIARRATVEKFVDKRCSFEHAVFGSKCSRLRMGVI